MIYWARTGFDSMEPEAAAGGGFLVGHLKRRGENETITSFQWASLRAWLRRTRYSRASDTWSRLLSRLEVAGRSRFGCSLEPGSVAASETRELPARNLVAGGGRVPLRSL